MKKEWDGRIEQCAELVRGYVSGGAIESIVHKMVCEEMGMQVSFDPLKFDDTSLHRSMYYDKYAMIQMKILAKAADAL